MKVARSATTPGNKKRQLLAGPVPLGMGGRENVNVQNSTKLIITNLAHDVTDSDVCELFSEFGSIREVAVHYNCWGYSLGTAHVVFLKPENAMEAARSYNGVTFDGRPMTITLEGSSTGGALLPPSVPVKMRLSFGPQHQVNPFRNPLSQMNKRGRPTKELKRLGVPRGHGNPQGRASVMGRGKPIGRLPTAAELDMELEEYLKQNKKGVSKSDKEKDLGVTALKVTPKNTEKKTPTGKRTPKTSKTPTRTPKTSKTPGRTPKIKLMRTPKSTTKRTPGRPKSNTPIRTPKTAGKTPNRPESESSTTPNRTPKSATKRKQGRPRKSIGTPKVASKTPNKSTTEDNGDVIDILNESESNVQDISLEPSENLVELLDISTEGIEKNKKSPLKESNKVTEILSKTPKKTPGKSLSKTPAKTPRTPASKRRATRGSSAPPPAKRTPAKTNQLQDTVEESAEDYDLENIDPLPAITKSAKKSNTRRSGRFANI